MIILLAGLKNISEEIYEAGDIDGCSAWSRFRHITLPLLTPSLFFVLIMSTMGALQVFGQVYIMTGGGPGTSTRVLMLYIYQTAYQWLKMGYASSMAWLFCLVIFAVTLIQWRYQSKWVHYQ
jgi:multiple sugar transport system permease protein